ncbi:hypothetical protein BCR42DRAFT_453584 [Absidia repens]|uniref:RNI-like protein n=1 Tax=Absidia repens TaxID=90262 RepID=A0A1X2I9A7_9FUNG|nr:hypothetical protein BCR42DRAFT_453584 [Absidia repens]
MSANNNGRNDDNRNRAAGIRGPSSALSSFLREHGIRVENRSRQQMIERRRLRREQSVNETSQRQTDANTTTPTDSAAEHDTTESSSTTAQSSSTGAVESILYTPAASGRRTRSSQARAIIDAATSSNSKTKKKRPSKNFSDDDQDDDNSDDEFIDPQPSSSCPRASSARIRVMFCSRCRGRFVRNNSDPTEETMCADCLSGKEPASARKPTKKRIPGAQSGNKVAWFMHGVKPTAVNVTSLQDICINVITDHIDDVEALGDISFINMDKIAKIICRNRQLTNHTARLFMQPHIRELCLYDCTNVDVTGLKNIAHFCPNLRTLRLYYCGRMTDDVIKLYGNRLQHLTSLTVSGCHLVTEKEWINFFNTVGERLHTFSLRHSNRFHKSGFKALVENCNKLQHLRLSRIVTLSNDWLDILSESGINALETLELSWPSAEPDRKYVLTPDHLNKVLARTGGSLNELILRGCTDMTDELLVDGILPHCNQLQKLTLEDCPEITSNAFQTLFSDEWKLQPTLIDRQSVTGLQNISVARCLNFDDDALTALLQHSGKALTRLDIHSVEKLTVSALEAIAGEVDDTDESYVTGGAGSGNDQYKRRKIDSTNAKNANAPSSVCKSLVYLDASFVRAMDDYVLTKLIRSCSKLKHVKVWGCHQVTDVVKVPSLLIVEGREFV